MACFMDITLGKIPEYNVDLVGSDSASINCFGLKAIEASGRVDCGHFLW